MDNDNGKWTGVSMEESRGYVWAPFAVPTADGNLIRQDLGNRYCNQRSENTEKTTRSPSDVTEIGFTPL